jgi:hypothetical protein
MFKTASLILLLALTACAGIRQASSGDPCSSSPGGYQCEVERYMNAS